MRIIAGAYKGVMLKAPKGLNTRPTPSRLRETLFNILQHHIEGAVFLDLFAGSGLLGFEALSRGANHVTAVDTSLASIQCIKQNAKQLGVIKNMDVLKSDVISVLERYARQGKQFDIIYADPPYNTTVNYKQRKLFLSEVVVEMVDTHKLVKPGGLLFVEEGSELKIDEATQQSLRFDRTKKCGKAIVHQFTSL